MTFIIRQFGHIYTSSGSFFIQPEEQYTVDNQNILHKITREKIPIIRNHSNRNQNGNIVDGIFIDDIEEIQHETESKMPNTKSTDDEDDKRESLCDACSNKGNKIYDEIFNRRRYLE